MVESNNKVPISPSEVVDLLRKKKTTPKTRLGGGVRALLSYLNITNAQLSRSYDVRARVLGGIFAFFFGGILFRYAYLSLLPSDMRDRLRSTASKQFETEIKLSAPRGQIVDRNGRPLAVSIMQPSLLIFPKRIPDGRTKRIEIARRLLMSLSELENITKTHKGPFWLRRQMSSEEFARYGDLSEYREFLAVFEEPKRFYPEHDLAAQLIGLAGVDNEGLEGIERLYNDALSGEAITAKVTKDARGKLTLTTPNGAVRPEPSTPPVKLSIDLSVQSFAENALRDGVLKSRAHSGSAVVMDVKSGEILAIASYPTYDLNSPPDPHSDKKRFHPVMDALELGSVVKPVFIAAAMEHGVIRKNDRLFCENGRYQVPGKVIRDTHSHGYLSIGDIIKVSSNICTYKIVRMFGRRPFYESIFASGLGRGPGTGLPGEWQGHVEPPQTWREVRFANMAFGQGLAISPLQITRAMGILARGGNDAPIKLVIAKNDDAPPEYGPPLQYVSPEVASSVVSMMKSVVEEEGGTGTLAAIKGQDVAGKTGTAEKYDPKTRRYSERTASFVGIVPADDPALVITVVIDEPQVRPAYGGLLAGPVFSEIGTKSLQYLNANGMFASNPNEFH